MYFVDAYNVLYGCPEMRAAARSDLHRAREMLIHRTAEFCIHTGRQVRLVFDGRGEHYASEVAHERGADALEVYYAAGHVTADSVIERWVYESRDKHNVCVVTRDRSMRECIANMGALTLSPDKFLQETRMTQASLGEVVQKAARGKPAVIEDALSDDSRAQLLALRKKLLD